MSFPPDVTTTLETPARTRPQVRASHFGLALLALAAGGFAIGTTEFVTMGLLPQVARGVDVSIPVAGHAISVYAVGVVVGAPTFAFLGARLPRRGLLIALMGWFAVFNAATAVAGSYHLLLAARFLAGLPHGAYFGVASLVAASLATLERRGRAVSRVMLGLAVANILGVPAATWLGQHLGWRSAYWTVTALGAVTIAMVWAFVPSAPGDPEATGRRELSAFTSPQVWLTLLTGAIGFGGMFAMYSYVAPTITGVGGLHESAVPWFLLSFGLGMTVGTWLGGHLADWSVFRSLFLGSVTTALSLLLFGAGIHLGWWAIVTPFLVSVSSSVLVVNLQLRLMQVAGDAQTLGAAMNHASLNLANALGAWLGGIVISAGLGYTAPAYVGVGLSLLGLVVLLASAALHRRTRR
ncbi:MFS transporter [Nocardioides mangrovicus]|uniref:MFS transporter n=1 Tax=Nocardioides mangrovicus TaxID=2478913 RepID=A0A3L8P3Q7_9ACTN|nr:MFS transporter [Nocardioides mangrovicus]RLV50026.1 MFS transporter [Nocardioides mangrovicus]